MKNTHQSTLIMCKISLQILFSVIKRVNSGGSGREGEPQVRGRVGGGVCLFGVYF